MALLFGRLSRVEIERHFDHLGWYFFVPVYLGLDDEPDGAMVAVRNGCPEWLMDLADLIFAIAVSVRVAFDPYYEPLFPFRVTGRIVKGR